MPNRQATFAVAESNAYYQDYQLTQDGISVILAGATGPQKGE